MQNIQCLNCAWRLSRTSWICFAYPRGIPGEFFDLPGVDHTKPHEGDGGYRFRALGEPVVRGKNAPKLERAT